MKDGVSTAILLENGIMTLGVDFHKSNYNGIETFLLSIIRNLHTLD